MDFQGSSKGGMAAVYHRRLYPGDVDGTVAYSAPNNVDDAEDSAYDEFLQNVGTDPARRDALTAIQNEALRPRREELVQQNEILMSSFGVTFDQLLGSIDRAFEIATTEMPFVFWQYGSQDFCSFVPSPDAPTDEIFAFLDSVNSLYYFSDQDVGAYLAYYVQAGTQIGFPTTTTDHLQDIRYPGIDEPRSYVPSDIPLVYQTTAMQDVDQWVKTRGSRLMFLYGELDPWSAEPFRLGPGTRDSFSFEVPGGNHGSRIANLPTRERTTAIRKIRQWAHVDDRSGADPLSSSDASASGENEREIRRHGRRPLLERINALAAGADRASRRSRASDKPGSAALYR